MLQKFIERPVLATVVSILLVLLGVISLVSLPVTQFPDIAPPSVQVQANYPGANAEVVARSVATPIEEAVNGVENMTYMTSNSNNDGTMTLSVYFKLGTDPNQAAVNVQNRVDKVTSQLPQEVIQAGISTQKQQNSMIMVLNLFSDEERYNETFLQNYARINIIPEIQRVPGVGQAMTFGSKDYAMRIWLKPDRLAAYQLSPQEVMAAIQEQNLEAAPGRLGENSLESFEYVIKYKGKRNKGTQFEDIILKANPDGSFLHLKDVARVELGSFTYNNNTHVNGKHGIGIAIYQTAGSNANDIQTQINALFKKATEALPAGIDHTIIYSTKEYLDESIEQVKHTLVEAFILVVIVVFIFLQNFRATLIPAVAVPVAIIGTFFFMQLFGFSINLLTLFALILAIGIVVDDAIVVVEAVHTKMEGTHLSPQIATIRSMQEISGAIISITLVMSAVFIPVGFMQGPAGVFYRQFAFTLAIAILISAINALTLSPALCALLLKDHSEESSHGKQNFADRFFHSFNSGFEAITNKYVGALRFLVRRKWLAIAGLVLVTGVTVWIVRSTPTGFIPNEDQSFMVYSITMPAGSSLQRTQHVVEKVDSILASMDAVREYIGVTGMNILTNSISSNYAVGFVRLKPNEERGEVRDLNQVMQLANQRLASIKEANVLLFNLPTVPGFSNMGGFELMLQDRASGSLDGLGQTANAFIGELMKRKEIAFAFTTFSTANPQLMLEVDEKKAKQLGVSISSLLQTMQVYYGSSFVSDFNRFGKFYRVIIQAEADQRATPTSLAGIYVKNQTGEMVPVNTLVSLKRVFGTQTVTRNNLFNSVMINGQPAPGYSSGDAIKAVEQVAKKHLPRTYSYEWTGMSKEEIASGGQSGVIFLLCLVFVYFLLAAQFESYILPFSVILSIPPGILGVFLFINPAGIDNNIYVQVGLIMLIGLLSKNAILIVEYALQRRQAGMGLLASALEAARLRLRPILMTSFAFIAGLVPLMRATGSSAMGNKSISIGAAGGMLTGVVLGLFIIPVLFVICQHVQEKIKRPKSVVKHHEEVEAVAP
ncbi:MULTISPECIES: efflux RND transporter permease subunit [Xanthocytophaga]|uniref:Efflux RND transporter permease subunit n=1 Tax=Xanthocytophaga agilis TaxID=3048010 RepID=A0AAE3UBV4_9BACT|nr:MULTISPECIES: efflux RND transporter permease subunit [Xanthocytophaga]MDJ1471786.1 efflux RND transporter permease subunit [Xanthocytophaga flavus]MDJ1500233.1 efflux RND transporter permease subunit [Xanthocytophaga agilis]